MLADHNSYNYPDRELVAARSTCSGAMRLFEGSRDGGQFEFEEE